MQRRNMRITITAFDRVQLAFFSTMFILSRESNVFSAYVPKNPIIQIHGKSFFHDFQQGDLEWPA